MPNRLPEICSQAWRHPAFFPLVAIAQVVILTLLVQLLILPHLAPQLHAGAGMLLGHDGYYFHSLALNLSQRIEAEGWTAWELRPRNVPVSGLAAFLYVLIAPSPLVFLPFNALSFGYSTYLIQRLTRQLTTSPQAVPLAGLCFILIPSSAIWYTQMHREVFFLPAVLLYLLLLLRLGEKNPPVMRIFAGSLFAFTLIWVMRPYFLPILTLATAVGLIWPIARCWGDRPRAYRVLSVSLALLLTLVLFPTKPVLNFQNITSPSAPSEAVALPINKASDPKSSPLEKVKDKITTKVLSIDHSRQHLLDQIGEAGSHIDEEVRFASLMDLLAYTPRALQIGYLAPFPTHSIAEGHSPGGTLFRRIVGLEMIFAYLGLIGFLILLRRRKSLWQTLSVLGFASMVILIYALAVPNIGSLYRYRFSVYISLVIPGFCYLYILWQARRRKSLKPSPTPPQ